MKRIRIYFPAFLFLLMSAVFSQQASAQQVGDECRTYFIVSFEDGFTHDDALERAIAGYHEEVQEYLDGAKYLGLTVHDHLDFVWYVREPERNPPNFLWRARVFNYITICGPPFAIDLLEQMVDP